MRFKTIIFVCILFLTSVFFSCNSGSETNDETDSVEIEKKNTGKSTVDSNLLKNDSLVIDEAKQKSISATKFICPQGDKEGNLYKSGTCPVCEMELIENPDFFDKNSKKK